MSSPYDESDQVFVVPPLKPDVAVVHAQRADAAGDTQIWGLMGCQKEVAFAAHKVIVVVEEVVDESVIRRDPNRTVIPGAVVDAVVEEPFACHPSFAQGYYDRDNHFYLEWDRIAKEQETLDAWLDEWVYGLANHREYVQKYGDAYWDAPARRRGRRGQLREVRVSDVAQDLGYSKSEIMIAASARQLAGVRNCFVGVGLPNIVCNLAQRTVAPELQLVYESGVFGARPERLPLSIGDPTLVTGATAVTSMYELFAYYLQAGLIDVAFLGGAQIDRYGNLNTTVIGSYDKPKVRLPGSGGACEIAIHARQILVIMRQAQRSFVETLHFRTSPGHSGDPEHDRSRGWSGSGPTSVVTDLGTYGFDEETGEMTLYTLHPGRHPRRTCGANMGWSRGWPMRSVRRPRPAPAGACADPRGARPDARICTKLPGDRDVGGDDRRATLAIAPLARRSRAAEGKRDWARRSLSAAAGRRGSAGSWRRGRPAEGLPLEKEPPVA
jgi:glutaconate CoA-transferase subunit B